MGGTQQADTVVDAAVTGNAAEAEGGAADA
jgi:hypothetical protein